MTIKRIIAASHDDLLLYIKDAPTIVLSEWPQKLHFPAGGSIIAPRMPIGEQTLLIIRHSHTGAGLHSGPHQAMIAPYRDLHVLWEYTNYQVFTPHFDVLPVPKGTVLHLVSNWAPGTCINPGSTNRIYEGGSGYPSATPTLLMTHLN